MKITTFAAAAALTFSASAAFAEPTAAGVELSFTAMGFGSEDPRDNWALSGAYDVFEHNLGTGVSTVTITGAYGKVANEAATSVGATYSWNVAVAEGTDMTIAADAVYIMDGNFSNGELHVSPSAKLSTDVTATVSVFGEVGYAWNASDDLSKMGGYTAIGADIAVSDSVAFVPSLIKPLDSDNNDVMGSIEVRINF